MGGEDDLVFPGEPVKDLPGYLLKPGVQEDLRVLDHDNAGQALFHLRVRLQKGEQVDGAHALSHPGDGAGQALGRQADLRRDLQDLLHVPVHGVDNIFSAAVFLEALVDLFGECVQIQLVQFVVQKLGCLEDVKVPWLFLLDETDAVKAVAAPAGLVEHTAARTHPLQDLILLQKEQVLLEPFQPPLRVHMVHLREHLLNIRIVLVHAVLITDPSVPVGGHGKGERIPGKGGELLTEILKPRLLSAVLADDAFAPQEIQILFRKGKRDGDLDVGAVLPEILRTDLIFSAHRPDGVQHGGLAGVVLSHQNQGVFNLLQMHVMDGFEIPDVQVCDLHGRTYTFCIRMAWPVGRSRRFSDICCLFYHVSPGNKSVILD